MPVGERRVDVLLPGLEPFTDVPMTRVEVLGPLPAGPATSATWTYETTDPPRGWSTQDWPTPLTADDQVIDYASRPERILPALPGF